MAKFDVTVVRALTQTTTIQVDARDKRSAAMVAGGLIEAADWEDSGTTSQKISAIEKVAEPELPGVVKRGRKRAA